MWYLLFDFYRKVIRKIFQNFNFILDIRKNVAFLDLVFIKKSAEWHLKILNDLFRPGNRYVLRTTRKNTNDATPKSIRSVAFEIFVKVLNFLTWFL